MFTDSLVFYKLIGYLAVAVAVGGMSYTYNKRFLEWLRFQSLGTRDYIVERLSMMFIDFPPQRILLGMFCLSVGSGLLVFIAFVPQWFPAILFGAVTTVLGWKAPRPIVDFLYSRRVHKFEMQMVDGLSLMSNGLKSGLSIVQSLSLVTEEMADPIRQELNLVLSENKLGVSLEEAFNNLAKRVISDDVEMFVTSVNILKETGGNLAETFDTIVVTIRERIKVENKIAALTAQGLYQGMAVMAVPPSLFVVFYQTDPEFMMPLVTTPVGWLVMGAVMTLMIVAFVVIKKIVKIEV
jgi:tight adherence protein B